MEREELLKQLYAKEMHDHGVHMIKASNPTPQDFAKGVGLLMLALTVEMEPGEASVRHQ